MKASKILKTAPRKPVEFAKFIEIIKKGNVETWHLVAQALKVDPETITRWKQTPEAQAAIAAGITRALDGMERAGKNDWHMWEAKLRMLGVNPAIKLESEEKVEVTNVNKVLIAYGIKEDGKLRQPIAGQIEALKKVTSGE